LATKSKNLVDLPNPQDLEMVKHARRNVGEAAANILRGGLSYIEGARLICAQRPFCAVAEDDPDFDVFVAVSSQSDQLPVGAERRNWAEHALARLQPETAASEVRAAAFAKTAAENLARRYGV
jgi:hypothetical protein